MVTDFVISTIQYIEKNLQVEALGAIVVVALILLAVIAAVLLVFRGVRLWYWKINRQIDALENIDKSLLEIKENLGGSVDNKDGVTLPLVTTQQGEEVTETISDVHIEEPTETTEEGLQTDIPKIVFDKEEEHKKQKVKPGYNIGKDGMVYVEEILREQIQF